MNKPVFLFQYAVHSVCMCVCGAVELWCVCVCVCVCQERTDTHCVCQERNVCVCVNSALLPVKRPNRFVRWCVAVLCD
jgi:hypothetical protein